MTNVFEKCVCLRRGVCVYILIWAEAVFLVIPTLKTFQP